MMRPMKVVLYNSIVEDFKKYRGFGPKQEQELLKKYKHIPPLTLGSIISLLVQRTMKYKYRKAPYISQRYCEQFRERVKNDAEETVVKLADHYGITPSLFVRSLLQHEHTESDVKEFMKDTTLIPNSELAYHAFLANLDDSQYGPYPEAIKGSLGVEYENRLERELKLLEVTYSAESSLKSSGFDKTPDVVLDVPIAVDGFVVNWIESKAVFGDHQNHEEYLNEQLLCYWNRFGPGLIIYWFGYLETLDSTPEVDTMFIIKTGFPKRDNIIFHDTDF